MTKEPGHRQKMDFQHRKTFDETVQRAVQGGARSVEEIVEATKKLLVRSGEQWATVVARKAHVADRVRDALQRLRTDGKVRKIEQIRAQWEPTV